MMELECGWLQVLKMKHNMSQIIYNVPTITFFIESHEIYKQSV